VGGGPEKMIVASTEVVLAAKTEVTDDASHTPIIKAIDAIKIPLRCHDVIVLSIFPPFLFAVAAGAIAP
jgi:hypothetical protein